MRTLGEEGMVALTSASSLWTHENYTLPDFLSLARENYGVLITQVNYQRAKKAQQQINAWAEAQTIGKIRVLIPSGVVVQARSIPLAPPVFVPTALSSF